MISTSRASCAGAAGRGGVGAGRGLTRSSPFCRLTVRNGPTTPSGMNFRQIGRACGNRKAVTLRCLAYVSPPEKKKKKKLWSRMNPGCLLQCHTFARPLSYQILYAFTHHVPYIDPVELTAKRRLAYAWSRRGGCSVAWRNPPASIEVVTCMADAAVIVERDQRRASRCQGLRSL